MGKGGTAARQDSASTLFQDKCKGKCNHVDCVLTRKDAEVICRQCQKPIGYGNAYYRIGGAAADLIHEACSDD